MSQKTLTIGIDCRLGGARHAGIGRYIQNLVCRLPNQAPDIQWVLFVSEARQVSEFFENSQLLNVKVVLAAIPHYSLAEQLQLGGIFAREKLDLLHVPHFNVPVMYRGPLVVTIHDLLWHEYKGLGVTTLSPWKYWLKYLAYRAVTTLAISQALRILVPTQTIKDTIGKHYPNHVNKVMVTKEGASVSFNNLTSAKQTPSKNIVYVGSLYPHKNIKLVIEALKKLPDYTLTIVGARSVFRESVERYVKTQNLDRQVIFAGYLADSALARLYHTAFALIQPSLSEGFGLTGIEAMASGVPVLASDIPIFKEVYQDAALFFDPYQVDSLVAAVEKLARSDRGQFLTKGQAVARQYSWDTMTTQTLAAYREALSV